MSTRAQEKPARVPVAKQAGEIRAQWAWTEECVWTDRMLAALVRGVKGGKWFSLIDKVATTENLQAAWLKVRRNKGAPGVDHQTIEEFERGLEGNLRAIGEQLLNGSYQPKAVRRKMIQKSGGGERPLGIPTVRDRVAQQALRHVLEPIFDATFAPHSYGFRPGRGAHDAVRRVDALLEKGLAYVVDADVKSYFDTIPREQLMARVGEKVSDGTVMNLLGRMLQQDVMVGLELWTPPAGTPQGAVISPLLANIYLNPLDHLMAGAGMEMVRYADDFVVLCNSRTEAERALAMVKQWMEEAGLTLHPEKTRIVDARLEGGFDFLGYHFERGKKWPRKKSRERFWENVGETTKRNNGHSLGTIITKLNRTLRGWFGYFKLSHPWTFKMVDGRVRRRLRSILRKRKGLRGVSHGGTDHHRWPDAFFRDQGLFSLEAAHKVLCESPATG